MTSRLQRSPSRSSERDTGHHERWAWRPPAARDSLTCILQVSPLCCVHDLLFASNWMGTMRLITVAGLLLTLLLAALDQTIVTTALPSITAEFGDIAHYAWVTTAYLLTSTVMVPIAAKLSDQFGRKPLLLVGS